MKIRLKRVFRESIQKGAGKRGRLFLFFAFFVTFVIFWPFPGNLLEAASTVEISESIGIQPKIGPPIGPLGQAADRGMKSATIAGCYKRALDGLT